MGINALTLFEGFLLFDGQEAIDKDYLSKKLSIDYEKLEYFERFLLASKLIIYSTKIHTENLKELIKLMKSTPEGKREEIFREAFKKWKELIHRSSNPYLRRWYLPTKTPLCCLVDYQKEAVDFLKLFKQILNNKEDLETNPPVRKRKPFKKNR